MMDEEYEVIWWRIISMANFRTRHGFNDDEVVSALQKQIRRGVEDDAFYWAFELCEDGENEKGFLSLKNHLMTIAYEDIGLGDPDIVLQTSIGIRDMERLFKINNERWRVILSYIILRLCRAEKSRISDHFTQYIHHVWKHKSPDEMEVTIPDYALDMNTAQGNLIGRTKKSDQGIEHFIEEGEILANENPDIRDIYEQEAHNILRGEKRK
jgi:replication-associated recombination protein RarA